MPITTTHVVPAVTLVIVRVLPLTTTVATSLSQLSAEYVGEVRMLVS